MAWRPYSSKDLKDDRSLLPPNWQENIREVIKRYGVDTLLTGVGSTSRERRTHPGMPVRVVDGRAIKTHSRWLWDLYEGPLRQFASDSFGKQLYIANLVHTAVNINYLSGHGAQYEWHVDSNPVTGLLFASDSAIGSGGSLVFKKKAHRSIVRPKAGVFICFDAREIPHRVAPLLGAGDRITVPMNYYESQTAQLRPDDLDKQIYYSATVPEGSL